MEIERWQAAKEPGEADLRGRMVAEGLAPHSWSNGPGDVLIYIGTDDIEASLAKIQALGGKVVAPKTEIPQTGWFAIFTDPTGNKIGLYTAMHQH